MRNRLWDKKIPTLLGLILITISVVVTTALVKQGALFVSLASPTNVPKDIRITNITDSSFTISFTTDNSVLASVNYGPTDALEQTALDDRDENAGSINPKKIHNFTVRGLAPSTKYLFSITSGEDKFQDNNSPFSVTTGTSINESPTDQEPMSGKIISPEGTPPSEAIVYLSIDDAQTISTVVKNDGSFLLPLNSLRNKILDSYFRIDESTDMKLLAVGDGTSSNILLNAKQISPVPAITLGNNYDFKQDSEPVATQSSQSVPTFPSFSDASGYNPRIVSPERDQGLTDQQPEFKGTATPNDSVEIVIHSDENIRERISTDSNGNWIFRPNRALSPGEHTVSIIARDKDGILKTITRRFTVFAQGTQVSQTATPSATISPSPSPTPTDEPSQLPTFTPTPLPLVVPIATISPAPTLPPTGNSTLILWSSIAASSVILAAVVFRLTKGKTSL